MEKTYKRVPFDIELAKKIQSGEVEGRIVTEEGELVRILCFNREHYCNILALCKVPNEYGESLLCAELNTGRYYQRIEEESEDKDKFLFIELPEETPKHNFKPFDKVLVRDAYCEVWRPDIFSSMAYGPLYSCLRSDWHYCIPFEGNEHLVGTTDKPKEE